MVILVFLVGMVYALSPPARKKRWMGKLRELGKALALAVVIYWVYMLVLFAWNRG